MLNQIIGCSHPNFPLRCMRAEREVLQTIEEQVEPSIDSYEDDLPKIEVRDDGKFVLIKPAPEYENVALASGGALGLVMLAALSTMNLTKIKHLSGTSSGAMVAAAVASGNSCERIEQFIDKVPVPEFREEISNFHSLYPDMAFQKASPGSSWRNKSTYMFRAASLTLLGHGYDHSGQRMVKLMDQFISNSVIKYLEDNKAYMPQKARRNQLNGDELRQLDRFQSYTRKDFSRDRRGKMVTFSDLAILHRLAPEKFKLLTITGWNASLNRSEYFDAKRTPDMPIAYAVRISASLPFNFQDVIYQGSVYQDGGLGSSMPTEVFCHQDGQPTAELHARTALLDFYRNGLSFAILYSTPSLEKNSLWSRLVDKLTSVPRPRKVLKADYRKVYEGGINTFTVYESDLRPMSFNVSRKKIMNARQKAQYAMVEQLYQRRKQAYMVEYDNLKALYQDLDKNAKLALRKAGPVSEQDYPRKKDREAMENLCKQARENELACNRPIFSGLLV